MATNGTIMILAKYLVDLKKISYRHLLKLTLYLSFPQPYIMKVVKAHRPTEVDHEIHFTHPPSPRTTSSAFPHQPEWQAYEQMRENQLHNLQFPTLFYKPLTLKALDVNILHRASILHLRNTESHQRDRSKIWTPTLIFF